MAISVPAAWVDVSVAEILPGEQIDQSDVVTVLDNHTLAYAETPTTYVSQIFRVRDADGLTTDVDSSTNYVCEWRHLCDPDILVTRVRILMRTDNASYAARAEVTSDDVGSTSTSSTMSSTNTNYEWQTTTFTRATHDSNYTTFTLAFWVASGGNGFCKAIHISMEKASSVALGAKDGGFIPLDQLQAADASPYTHSLLEHFMINSLAVRRRRHWTRCSISEDKNSASKGSYRQFRSTATEFATVARELIHLPDDVLFAEFEVDGIAGRELRRSGG